MHGNLQSVHNLLSAVNGLFILRDSRGIVFCCFYQKIKFPLFDQIARQDSVYEIM